MKSAATIRTCSQIMMVITIIASIILGAVLIKGDDYAVIGFLIMVFGIFSGIMINALFQGFADIIDNTYAVALKVNGKDVLKIVEKSSGDISFQAESKVCDEKKDYADELFSKGLISQEEYNKILRW